MKQIALPHFDQNIPPQLICKSNELIEARFRLSIEEQRIILLLASQLTPADEDFNEYELQVAEFAQLFGLELNGKLYTSMEQAAEGLLGRVIALKTDTEDKIAKTVWFSYIEYIKGKGRIKLRFDQSLKPYLLQLKQHFTQYPLRHVVNFRCQYSIRLYELLKMDAYKAKDGGFRRTLNIVDYREMLGIRKDEYTVFSDLRRRVIEPPVKEITEQTDLKITDIEYIRKKRRVTALTFHVELRSDQAMLQQQQAQETAKPELHRVIKELVDIGFAQETATRFKNKYGVRRIERNIAYAMAKQQEGLVKDVPAYLNKAITEDMGGAWDVQRKEQAKKKKQQANQTKARESKAERAHMERLAAMGGVPLETLLKDKQNA